MVGGTKAISPWVKSASAELFPDLHTMSAPSGEEHTLEEAAQVPSARHVGAPPLHTSGRLGRPPLAVGLTGHN